MKQILFIFWTVIWCADIYAQAPIRPKVYQYDIYIDNIWVWQNSQSSYDNISTALRRYYYGDSLNLKQRMFLKPHIERSSALSIADNRLIYRTRKARDGYLYVNKKLAEWLIVHNEEINYSSILYRINGFDVLSGKDVGKLISLKKNQIDTARIFINADNNVVVDVFVN